MRDRGGARHGAGRTAGIRSGRTGPPEYDKSHHDPDYPTWDADDHPDDWQPVHDHRRVRHNPYAVCAEARSRQHVVCHWSPSRDVAFAAYEVWRGSAESAPTQVGRIEEQGASVFVDDEPRLDEHVIAYMIRAVDARGEILEHTFPVLVRRWDGTRIHRERYQRPPARIATTP